MKEKSNRLKSILNAIAIALVVPLFILSYHTLSLAVQPDETFVWIMQGERQPSILTKLTSGGTMLWQLEPEFGQSLAIGIDPHDGSVWAPNLSNNELFKVDAFGKILFRIPGLEGDILNVDPNDGSVWFGGPNENQVVKLNADGVELFRVSGFDFPSSFVVDPYDSSVWVADGGGAAGRKLVKLTANGEELFRRDVPGFFSNAPQQIDVYSVDGSVWHGGFNDVFKWTADGALLIRLGGFDRPVSVAVDQRDGSVWVADLSVVSTGAVVKLDSEGNELIRKDLGIVPLAVSVDSDDGSVWVGTGGDDIDGAVFKLSPNGEIILKLQSEAFNESRAIRVARVHTSVKTIEIDIKPGSYPNSINLKSTGKVPVAILTTDYFDVYDVDPVSCVFAGAYPLRWNMEDVDHDGDHDMIFHFMTQELELNKDSTEATIECETFEGMQITGTDSVNIVPKGNMHVKKDKKKKKK
jgi:streptogramin lyase